MEISLKELTAQLKESALMALAYLHNRLEKEEKRAQAYELEALRRELSRTWDATHGELKDEVLESLSREYIRMMELALRWEEKEKECREFGEEEEEREGEEERVPDYIRETVEVADRGNWQDDVKKKKAHCPSLEEGVIKYEGYKVSVKDVSQATGLRPRILRTFLANGERLPPKEEELLLKWVGLGNRVSWYREGEKEEIIVEFYLQEWEVKSNDGK